MISSNWLALKRKGNENVTDTTKKSKKDISETVSDIIQKKREHQHILALDCEMVEGESIEHMLARVSLVDYDGRIVYDAHVQPQEAVKDYRTNITGITKEILHRKGEPFDKVCTRVLELMKNKVLVGHAVHHDFDALSIPMPDRSSIRDTCCYPPLRPPKRKHTPSLRLLAEYWLNKQVQSGSHSSVEDARTTMMLYKRFQKQWEETFQVDQK